MLKVLVLVDGEHYPPVTRWGLDVARERGLEPVAAMLVGGTEKLGADRELDLGGVPLERAADLLTDLTAALERHRPEAVLDLSDEPVMGYRARMLAVAVTLAHGLPYLGPGFRFDPPPEGAPLPVPTLAVIGTGKRTGKTAIAGHVARVAAAGGRRPVVVAMGRGGPEEPEVAEGPVDLDALRRLVAEGRHAASDYLEDALTAGVTTVGARRCGGGLAGEPFATNVDRAAEMAVAVGAGTVILEGSGASIPPVPWDAGVLVVPAALPPEFLGGYLGPYRLLRSDLVCFTMVSGPGAGPQELSALTSHVRRLRAGARIVLTDLLPTPLDDVRGKRVFFATTAPSEGASAQAAHLERDHGVTVVASSSHLADRAALAAEIAAAPPFEVLLTELKAAAVDVAAEAALARGAEVVFVDNRPVTRGGDGDLDELLEDVLRLSAERASERTGTR